MNGLLLRASCVSPGMRTTAAFVFLLLLAGAASAHTSGCRIAVIVDGVERPQYAANGAIYIEALRGREYSLRLINPTPHRVAVALSVDGLNTIDAQHTDGWGAAKWVLDPYETAEIAGWQVSDSTARKFFFTGERNSYGAALGQTENLGVIEAIFYRERPRAVERGILGGAPDREEAAGAESKKSDDYAATGMGGRTQHDVVTVDIDLDPRPIASARLRYEFRPQLVKLGVLPAGGRSPLERREKAQGFERYCPEPE